MGFLSGLTANGLLGAVGRIARAGGGPFAPAAPAYGSDGRDLLDRLRTAMDPERLAVAQALLAGDYSAVSRITEPLRWQRLADRREMKRAKLRGEPLVKDWPNQRERHPAANPAFEAPGAGSEMGTRPFAEQDSRPPLSKPAFKSAGQEDPFTRQMAIHPSAEQQAEGEAMVQDALGAVQGVRNRQAKIMKGINGFGYMPTRDDYSLLARALFAEGRNTPHDMEALAHGIINRVRPLNSPRQGRELRGTLREVLSVPPQFSFWPNRRQPEGSASWVLSAHPERMNSADRDSWKTAIQVAERVLDGASRDPTEHAPFFFASDDYDGRIEDASDAPTEFFRNGIADGSLIPSPYDSPYPAESYPPTNYFFRYRGDEGPRKR